jgi:hypothetical protein
MSLLESFFLGVLAGWIVRSVSDAARAAAWRARVRAETMARAKADAARHYL